MAGWLTKATSTFSRKAVPAEPQPFTVWCACRNEVGGIRESRHQVVRCARCGTSLFVLPQNPYPHSPPSSAPAAKSKSASTASPRRSRSKSGSRPVEPPAVPSAPRVPIRHRLRARAQRVRGKARGIVVSAVKRQREIFTPFRLVLMAMAAVAVGTGYWVWHNNALENADVDFKRYADSGEQAFTESSFAAAAGDLAKACAALDLLGRDDSRALVVRQMFREATAASKLLSVSLLDVVDDAQKAQERDDAKPDDRFATLYGQNWIVIFSRVEQTVDADGVNQLVFDYPLPVGGRRIVISVRADQASQIGSVNQPRQAIVAAKLESCRRGGPADENWIVRLDPESVFLWSSFEPLVALGMTDKQAPPDDPVRAVLDEQRRQLGVDR